MVKHVFKGTINRSRKGKRGDRKSGYLNFMRKCPSHDCGLENEVTSVIELGVLSHQIKNEIPAGLTFISDHQENITFVRHKSWEFISQRGLPELSLKSGSSKSFNICYMMTWMQN
jgi:hypothetical protein